MDKIKEFFSWLWEIICGLWKTMILMKNGVVLGLYYWLLLGYELFIFGVWLFHKNNSFIPDDLYNVYEQNIFFLSAFFILIFATLSFAKFETVDKGDMIWNATLLILFIVVIVFVKDNSNNNIIYKAVLSLGTVESFIKNIFKSRESYEKKIRDKQLFKLNYEGLKSIILLSEKELKVDILEKENLGLQKQDLILKNQEIILQKLDQKNSKSIVNRIFGK